MRLKARVIFERLLQRRRHVEDGRETLKEKLTANDVAQFSRQQIRTLGLAATTQVEIEQARQMLREWQQAHPEEPKMSDIFEQLYILEDAWRTLAAETRAAETADLVA